MVFNILFKESPFLNKQSCKGKTSFYSLEKEFFLKSDMILIEKRFDEKRFLKKFRGFYSERKKSFGLQEKIS